ncbi:MAG: RNase adapter RapZ [Myxococcales bacterium]|nr:RNase adapter RapZ [Myxococcales bacterium]
MSDAPLELKVVTGLSGAGISTALDALEDRGWFCVDNLPPPLVSKLLDLAQGHARLRKLALGLDARSLVDVDGAMALLNEMEAAGCRPDVLFLDASDGVLLRRFSTTRRPHPLVTDGLPVPDAIRAERSRMYPLRERADRVIDTSDLNVHECKRQVQAYADGAGVTGLVISVMSFGFRHGVPPEADIVWDVRFLPNPHFVEALRPMSGRDAPVSDFVLTHPVTGAFLERFMPLLDAVVPGYEHEGKAYLTIAIGCTGGRHRSVAVAERVAEHLRGGGRRPKVRHRDLEKESR